jgi:riboflavin biosynthesis pyrimidine reductase
MIDRDDCPPSPSGSRELEALYPAAGKSGLKGLYLCEDLRSLVPVDGSYVYTNFVASLDGRIAVERPDSGRLAVPGSTANARDWRLLLELAAPADALIVSGRYLRQLAAGEAQAWPPFSGEAPSDLVVFRERQGLVRQPALVVVTRTLDLPVAALERLSDRRLILATGHQADGKTAAILEGVGAEVLRLGDGDVDGARLVEALGKRGLRLVYSIAGPAVLYMLASRRVLRRIYLTTVMRVLAGDSFATLARGALLEPPYDFRLAALYLDRHGPDGVEQLFQVYDRREDPQGSPTDST